MKHKLDRQNVTEHYARLASVYDTRWSFYVRATTDATVARIPDRPADVLDIGCGTGALLTRMHETQSTSRLTGVDASAEMLEIARERLPPNISLRKCWAEELPFDDCTFDTVASCNMFHLIRCPNKALREMFRVLRPCGKLIITDWCDDYLMCKLCDIYFRWFDPSHFRIYGTSECSAMLNAANARQIKIAKYKISVLWGLMTVTACKDSTSHSVDASSTLRHSDTHAARDGDREQRSPVDEEGRNSGPRDGDWE